jgi:hypothetical protein
MKETKINNEAEGFREIAQEAEQEAGDVLGDSMAKGWRDDPQDEGEMLPDSQEVLASSEEITEVTGEVLASSAEMLEFFQKGWDGFLEGLVEKVARKAGYLDDMTGEYREYLENVILLQRERLGKKIKKMGHKVNLRPRETTFAEDIKAYFRHSVQSLMEAGKSEDEAFQVVLHKVERAILRKPDFDDFTMVFDGFWTQEYLVWDSVRTQRGELIGLFYSGFLLLGITLGSFLGYVLGDGLGTVIIGCVVGLGLGLSCGIFMHAFLRGRAQARTYQREQ